jgi:hypothetical protein
MEARNPVRSTAVVTYASQVHLLLTTRPDSKRWQDPIYSIRSDLRIEENLKPLVLLLCFMPAEALSLLPLLV